MRRYERFRTGLIFLLCALTAPLARAAGTTTYEVTLNTAPLVAHPAGPFSILFAFTDGSGLADANNTISVTNVDFGGGNGLGSVTVFGGASGSLESGLTITDASPLNLFSEGFSPGQVLRFTVTLTTNDDGGGTPDRITFYVLDASGTPVPTLAPAADYLLGIDLGSAPSAPAAFGTDPSRSPSNGNPIAISAPTLSTDTTPPVTTASVSPVPNANGWNNTNITVTLNSTDNELGGTGVKQITYSATGAQTIGNTIVSGGSAAFAVSAEGVTTITFFGTDNAGNIEAAKTITVEVDKTPPTVACSASPNVLWPPNNKLVPVNASVTVSDALSGPAGFTLVSVASNEPDSGQGDIQGFAAGTASTNGQLRAQRLGSGNGRVYIFTYSGSDRAGNTTSCTTTVSVPHDQGQN
jgi:hypothetical protein